VELNPLRPGASPDALGVPSPSRGRPVEEGAAPPQPSADEAIISLEARRRTRFDAAAGAVPEVREALVADLRAAILSGRYELDPKAIAGGLIGQDLIGRDADPMPDAASVPDA
jgi:flagellar biosynthesis anti-sigma factor FlgM